MESALLELTHEGAADDVVPVIIRLHDGQPMPTGIRPVASFGLIHTARVRRGDILRLREAVASMKRPQDYTPAVTDNWEEESSEDLAIRPTDIRRTVEGLPTGRGVILCHLDWGLDFAHPAFRHADGRTRLIALWDQAAQYDRTHPNVYGFGRIYSREEIDRALRSADPRQALGYRWWSSDRGNGSHGTHTLGISGGTALSDLPAGFAPEADLLFVDLSTRTAAGPQPLGSSTDLLEGVDFAHRCAGDRCLVVNASLGRQAGQHDGLTLTEQALDWFASHRRGRAMVMSCGNYFNKRAHAQLAITPGDTRSLTLELAAGDRKSELDLWYSRNDRLRVGCHGPGGISVDPLAPDEQADLIAGRQIAGRLYHRSDDPNNGDHQVSLFLHGNAPAGTYAVSIEGASIGDGRVHAWVERDPAGSSRLRFVDDDVDGRVTVGTICNGFATLAVAAYDAHDPNRPPATFSSSSPTRDGRTSRPSFAAAGVKVLSARSAPRSGGATPTASRMSGTSMAAPAAAGTVAMLFECAPRPLGIDEISGLLAETVEPVRESARERLGAGYLNPAAAVAACRALPPVPTNFIPRPLSRVPKSQFRLPSTQESVMSPHDHIDQDYSDQDEAPYDCDADSELERVEAEAEAEAEAEEEFDSGEIFATMEGEAPEDFDGDVAAEDEDAARIRDHRRRNRFGGGGLPFQFQIPIGGAGGLGLGIPIGGRNSPFALSVPFGGTPPAPPPSPSAPGAASPPPPAATPAATPAPAAPPSGDPPLVTSLDLPQDPLAIATEVAFDQGELGGDGDMDCETIDAEGDAALLEEAGRIAALQQESFTPDYAVADARYAGEQLVHAAETLVEQPESSESLCRMLGEQIGEAGEFADTSDAPSSLYSLFDRIRRGEPPLPRFLGRRVRLLARPGATLDGLRPRRGDLMLRVLPGQRFVQLSIVASPELVSLERLGERGWQSEGRSDPLPGRYVQVVEAWPLRRSDADGFARRLANAADIVPLDTMVLRLLVEGEADGDAIAEDDPARPRLAIGARGAEVTALQRRLNEFDQRREAAGLIGLGNLPLFEDGQFGPRLQAAVQALQRLAPPGMVPQPDGIMDDASWAAIGFLEAALSALTPGVQPSPGRAPASLRTSTGAIAPGQETLQRVPLLAAHRGTSPDMVLRWNAMPADTRTVDLVLHLHGFSGHGEAMQIVRDKLPNSGLDFLNPDQPADNGRSGPTLGILPRGNFYGGRTHMGYDFPALFARGAVGGLLRLAMERFAAATGLAEVAAGRLIVTAHSGGGAALMRLLGENDPDEIHCFDALYSSPAALIRWAQERIRSGRGATSALRVLFRDGEGTARNSHAVASALAPLVRGPPDLASRFRAEAVAVPHNDIPRRFGWRLLMDATADLGPASSRRRVTPRPAPADGEETWAEGEYDDQAETDPPALGLTQAEVDRLARCDFGNAAELERYFASAGGFAHWFNRTLSGQGPFVRAGRGGELRVPTGEAASGRFRRFWDRPDLAYRQPRISLLEFASLMAIVLNETDGDFAGRTESSGRGGGGRRDPRGDHRGLAYFFDRIELRPGHFKASYNHLSGGRTAGSLFNDPVFIQAHGALGGADRLARNGDADDRVWHGQYYPAAAFSVDESLAETAFIRETDFYKFRGRGIIQTTGRASYIQLVRSVKAYRGSNPVLTSLASAWAALPDQEACTASTNAQWEQLFAAPETLGMAFALHSPTYRVMSRQADVLNSVPAASQRGQSGSIYLMGRRISGSPVYGAQMYRDRVLGLLRAMLQLPLAAVPGTAPAPAPDPILTPIPAVPAAPRPGQELEHRPQRRQPGDERPPDARRRASVRPSGQVPTPDEATARQQWESHPRAHRHFENSFANYLTMAPKFAQSGVADAAAYLTDHMTELRFMGRRTPGHRGWVAPLAEAEAALAGRTLDPPITSFWSLNVRTMRGSARLSLHSLGLALDINPDSNPHIRRDHRDQFAVIHAVTGVDLLRTPDPARLREASAQFSRDFNSQWVAAQTDPAITRALRSRQTLSRLQEFAARGFCTLDLALIQALLGAGLRWGGQWPNSKDFMHFELP